MANRELLQGTGKTVLLVEDEVFLRNVVAAALQHYGYKVLTASDGTEALAQYLEHGSGIDLVLTDVVMEEMNGVELSRALKKINPHIKIIASTGHPSESLISEFRELGVDVILGKPYSIKQLLVAVNAATHSSWPD